MYFAEIRRIFALDNNKKRNIMKDFLNSHYAFRINSLRQVTEYAKVNENENEDENENGNGNEDEKRGELQYKELDDMVLNTIFFEMVEAGIEVRRHYLECYLFSGFVPQYHPFHSYMNALPTWDGRDRVSLLAERVSHDELWKHVFHIWLRALVAQWMGHQMQAANSMVPVLISERQGMMKSTFCRMLVPPELEEYYLDKLDFTQAGEYDRMMAQFGLINLDEMDRYSAAAMARFKSATQMKSIVGHSTRSVRITHSARLASFIGTTNKRHILNDDTGSRRFFCQLVEQRISCRPINHAQLFAQLRHEVLSGERTWFTRQEEQRIQEHNRKFQCLTPVQNAILQHFHIPADGEQATPLPARDIYDKVQQSHPKLLQSLRLCDFAKELKPLFRTTRRKKDGLRYYASPA